MEYPCFLIETHTNTEDDWADVILHDAVTAPMFRDGDDIVIPIPDGIIVLPNRGGNETDRYLRTGEAEIRLRRAECRTEFVPFEQSYDILHHRYVPETSTYLLLLHSNWSHRARQVEFRCDSVEYRFDGFAGDSWIQQARDHRRESIRTFLLQGRGEAVWSLRRMSDEERHEYVGMVLHAACNDLRRDRQCDAERSQYLFDLIESFGEDDRETIRRALLQEHWRVAAKDTGFGSPTQYVRLLQKIRDSGEPLAEQTIRQIYDTIRREYETTPVPEEGRYEIYDRYLTISCLIGKPLPEDDEERPHLLPPAGEPMTMERLIGIMRNPGDKIRHPAAFRNYLTRCASVEDIQTLADAARNEPDPDAKARLYSLFSNTAYPGDPAELIALAKEREPDGTPYRHNTDWITSLSLQRALARLRHPAVREYGFELLELALQTEILLPYALDLWVVNYEEDDLARFLDVLEGLPDAEDGDGENLRHSAEFTITQRMFTRRFDDPRTYGHLVWVYNHTYCSCCRRNAVKILYEHGMLQEAIRKQCLFDCDPETRKIAEAAGKMTEQP